LVTALQQVGLVCGGEPGAVLTRQLALSTSPDTLLRAVRRISEPELATPRVLGVDDWSYRRGHRYGTLLVDLERHRPVDLLPERTVEALATWLLLHPGVEIIARDRAQVYADGATLGAPAAVQVVDRWHLLKNLGEAIQRMLDRYPSALQAVTAPASAEAASPATLTSAAVVLPVGPPLAVGPADPEWASAAQPVSSGPVGKATPAQERYAVIQALLAQGVSQRAIARQLGLNRRTVQRYAAAEQCPQRAARTICSTVAPYGEYLLRRWAAGDQNRTQLWREIQQQGYQGSYSSVYRFLLPWPENVKQRRAAPRGRARRAPLSARQGMWLLLRNPADLTPEQTAQQETLCKHCEAAAKAYSLAQEFRRLLRERESAGLAGWLAAARASGIKELHQFARGLEREKSGVQAAFEQIWSNGQTEGQVQRLKVIKRSMYGRAKFDLLRQRFLHAA
jgi:transposase